jgi:transcriptional regulator with XRE-family HTH domain
MTSSQLHAFRKSINLTQKELAKLVGVTPNTIYNYENGGVIPPAKIKLFEKLFLEYGINNKKGEFEQLKELNVIKIRIFTDAGFMDVDIKNKSLKMILKTLECIN